MVGAIFNFLLALMLTVSIISSNVMLFKARDILPDIGIKKRDVRLINMLLLVVPFQLLIILATLAKVGNFTFPFQGEWIHVLMWVSRIAIDVLLVYVFILGVKNWNVEDREIHPIIPSNNLWTVMLGVIVVLVVLTDFIVFIYGLVTGNWISDNVSILSKYF